LVRGHVRGLASAFVEGSRVVVSGASGAEASAGDCDRCRCRSRETHPPEGAAAGALEPPPPPDMGGGRSPESSAQLLDMRAVCVEQSPGSGRCVRGNAGARPGAAKQHGRSAEKGKGEATSTSRRSSRSSRSKRIGEPRETGLTRIGFGFNVFDVAISRRKAERLGSDSAGDGGSKSATRARGRRARLDEARTRGAVPT
jgi:hypothetical protein